MVDGVIELTTAGAFVRTSRETLDPTESARAGIKNDDSICALTRNTSTKNTVQERPGIWNKRAWGSIGEHQSGNKGHIAKPSATASFGVLEPISYSC